jgi:glyoxylase-like metal-dependent hydrolase (beta-lactamase superfamily II)
MAGAGVVPLHLADVRIPEGDPRSGKPFPIVAHAVAHRDGVFLFDTGIGTDNAEIDEVFAPLRTSLQDALAVHGIAMADVTAVANCHLHFDHSGQNALFPDRPIFAQEREFRMVHEPNYTVPEWIDVPGLSYELLDGEAGIAPGLRLIPTPGHTPGHQSLVVETDGGTVVLAGQAVQSIAEWEGAIDSASSGQAGAMDRDAYLRSVERLRGLDPARVHFAHDPSVWERGE